MITLLIEKLPNRIAEAKEAFGEIKKSNKKQKNEKSVREAVDNEGVQEYNRKAITPYADVMAVTKESYEHRDWATNPIRSVLLVQETMRFYLPYGFQRLRTD